MNEPNYTIVSICNRQPTEPYYCLNQWWETVKEYKPLVISSIGSNYQGLCDKPKFVYRAIKQGIIKTDFIIFCDSWDLVFATTPEEIIKKFLEFECDLVISAEKNCFPDDLKDEYDALPHTSSFKYLNSGVIVGYTDKLLQALEAMEVESIPDDYFDGEKNIHFNDQFEYQKAFLKQPVHIKLDYQQVLSRTLHEAKLDELDFSEPRIRNIETNSYPCTLHMNGNGKSENGIREAILKHLNLLT